MCLQRDASCRTQSHPTLLFFFFPAVGTNLSLESACRRTLQLYGEQFPESAVARGRARDDSDVKAFKTSLIAPIDPSSVKVTSKSPHKLQPSTERL